MQSRFLRIISLAVFITGIFLMINSQVNITGGVIGIPAIISAGVGIIGLIMMLFVLISFVAAGLEERVKAPLVAPEELVARTLKVEAVPEKRSIIMDTSIILNYNVKELAKIFSEYGEVLVPRSVLDEIWNPKTKEGDYRKRAVVEEHCHIVEAPQELRTTAREYLGRTDKAQLRGHLLPYLTGEKKLTAANRREADAIAQQSEHLRRLMLREGIDSRTALRFKDITISRMIDYLENCCRVSEADVDILALALKEASENHHAIIEEKDTHLEDAVKIIRTETHGGLLDCVNPYQAPARAYQ